MAKASTARSVALAAAIDAGDLPAVHSALSSGAAPRTAISDRAGIPDILCQAIASDALPIATALVDAGATCAGQTQSSFRPIDLLMMRLTGRHPRHEPIDPAPIPVEQRPAWIALLVRLAGTSTLPPASLAARSDECWEHPELFASLLSTGRLGREDLDGAVLALRPEVLERLLERFDPAAPAPSDARSRMMAMMRGDLLGRVFDSLGMPRHTGADPSVLRTRAAACVRLLAARPELAVPVEQRAANPIVLALLAGVPEVVPALVAAGYPLDQPEQCRARGFLPEQSGIAPEDPKWSRIDEPGVTPLTVAVRLDSAPGVVALLDAGAGPDAPDGNGLTPLAWSERLVRPAITELLTSRGAKRRSAGSPLRQLIAASESGDVAQVQALLAAGTPADGMMEISQGGQRAEWTPLLAAVQAADSAVAAALLASGADPGRRLRDSSYGTHSPFLAAAEAGRSDLLALMLPHASDKGQRIGNADPTSGKGSDALTLAARSGRIEAVRVLLDAGLKPCGEALHAAIDRAHFVVARALVESGAKLDAVNSVGDPPLTAAIRLLGERQPSQPETVGGVTVTIISGGPDAQGEPLAPAPKIDAFVRFLIERGAKPDLRANQKGTRPLCAACAQGRRDWAELLLERGAAIEPPFGHIAASPLMEAAQAGHTELIPFLIDRGADIHRRTPEGHGVVWRACCSSETALRVLPALLAAGADPNHGDKDGRTPLDVLTYAEDPSVDEIRDLLRRHGAKLGDELRAGKPETEPGQDEAPEMPDFTERVDQRFSNACAALAKDGGFEWQQAADIAGTMIATIPTEVADRLLAPAAVLARQKSGLVVVASGSRSLRGERTILRAIPSGDWADSLRCAGTNGCNYDQSTDDIIAWLRRLEKDCPFVITGVAHDLVEGHFLGPIAKPAAVAKRMYRFCPDLVDQGCGTVSRLADELKGDAPTLYFWWD